jgi:type III secretion protein W
MQGLQTGNLTLDAMKAVAKEESAELRAEQQTSQLSFLNQMEEATNPLASRMQTTRKEIKTRFTSVQKMTMSGDKAKRLTPIEMLKQSADEFQRRNPELESRMLMNLRNLIKPTDSKDEILRKVLEFYPDVSLADEALEFLLETTEGDLFQQVQIAKSELEKNYEREIAAGRNIGALAREAAAKGLGAPTSLRDLYRDITGNPRESLTLFQELAARYTYENLKSVIQFLFHSLGADLKSRGPSIPRGLLHRLLTETRSLQAIMGVYRFFRMRMRLIERLFAKNSLTVPQELNFEALAKALIGLAADRFPTSDKALQYATRLGIEKWLLAKIIVLSQLRDAVREVAVTQIYSTFQHRDEVYASLIEALERLEEELEELEEKEEEDDNEEDEDSEDEKGEKETQKAA